MTLANAMILVDQTAVPLTLPDILEGFDVGTQEVQWVLSGSLLALTALLVLGGRLGDMLGHRRVFLAGTALFTGASAFGGLAPDFWLLLAARVLQGAGGALMLPATVAIVSAAFPPEARGRALGTMGGVAAVAGALGPTIGGVLTSAVSWRAVLLVNVPLAVVCVIVTLGASRPMWLRRNVSRSTTRELSCWPPPSSGWSTASRRHRTRAGARRRSGRRSPSRSRRGPASCSVRAAPARRS